MNKIKEAAMLVVLSLAVWTFIPQANVQAQAVPGHQMHPMKEGPQQTADDFKKIYAHHIPALSELIEKAVEAIKTGDEKTALTHLQKAQTVIAMVKQAVEKKQLQFANTKCPMMGGTINPEKVTDALTRKFEGQTVAFCCGGCPGLWDRLTDEEKQVKLAAVKPDETTGRKTR